MFPSLFNRLPTLHGSAGFRYLPSAWHITAGRQLCVRVQKSLFCMPDHKYDTNIRAVSAIFWHWTNYFLFFYELFFLAFEQKIMLIKLYFVQLYLTLDLSNIVWSLLGCDGIMIGFFGAYDFVIF